MEVVLAFCFKNFEIFSNIKQVKCVFENVRTEFSSLEILQEPEAREDQLKWRESGDKGTKRYGRRENGVREAGGCHPPVPPPLNRESVNSCLANSLSVKIYTVIRTL